MTFKEVYKILYKKYKVARWDDVDKKLKVRDITTISTYDLFALINGLKETYAPKIKMTIKQRNKLRLFLYENEEFEVLWYRYGYGGEELYKEFSKNELMHAWLHPELIEVSDD